MLQLSDGQMEVRRVLANSPYKDAKWSDRRELSFDLLDEIEVNKIITNDVITGEPLGYSRFSETYLDFISMHSKTREISNRRSNTDVKLENFVYQRSDLDQFIDVGGKKERHRRCHGGVKFDSTFRCLMGLAQGESLDSLCWSLKYFEKEEILTIRSDGNHRTLAHVLYGDRTFNPDSFDIYSTQLMNLSGDALNAILLELDANLDEHTYRFSIETLDDAKRLVSWGLMLLPEERSLIWQFLRERSWEAPFDKCIGVEDLETMTTLYQEVKSGPKMYKFRERMKTMLFQRDFRRGKQFQDFVAQTLA